MSDSPELSDKSQPQLFQPPNTAKKQTSKASLKTLLVQLRPYPGKLWLFFLASILVATASACWIPPTKIAVDILSGVKPEKWGNTLADWLIKSQNYLPDWQFIPHNDTEKTEFITSFSSALNNFGLNNLFLCMIVLLFLTFAVKSAAQFGLEYLQFWLSQRLILDTQRQVVERLLHIEAKWHDQSKTGDLLSRLTNDMNHLAGAVKLFCVISSRPMILVFTLCAVLLMSWEMTVIGLATLPPAVILVSYLNRKMRHAAHKAQISRADLTETLTQILGGLDTIRAFAAEDAALASFSRENRNLFSSVMKHLRTRALMRPIVELTSEGGMLVILAVCGAWVITGHSSPGDLLTFIGALLAMYKPWKELVQSNAEMQECLPALDRIQEILDVKPGLPTGDLQFTAIENRIRFEQVTFSYVNASEPALIDFSLDIPKGKTVALVGFAGSGKSTVARLLLRFYDPDQGDIYIDNTKLRDISPASYRQKIAYVGQEAHLFAGSVRDNVAFGTANATDQEVIDALKQAQVWDEIQRQPQGIDSDVGERGRNLSGGQRQRVAIARAICRNAPLLILDEATSALDATTESHVQTAFSELLAGRTTLVIAHRLSTIRNANTIAVLERGKLVASGSHDQLITSCDIYANFVHLQNTGQTNVSNLDK